jgi:hypothetical protein
MECVPSARTMDGTSGQPISGRALNAPRRHLQLSAAEWVEVRSEAEILATLDEQGCLDGMPFMPEMLRYCGTRLQVSKRAHKTCDTISYTGLRHVDDAVHLENVRCDGKAHGGCDAGCMVFWKEAWLKRFDRAEPEASETLSQSGCTESQLEQATRVDGSADAGNDVVYKCQATELLAASTAVPSWDLRHLVEDYSSGNVEVAQLVRGLAYRVSSVVINRTNKLGRKLGLRSDLNKPLIAIYDGLQQLLPHGVPFPRRHGTVPEGVRTPAGALKKLQAGEWVRVKSYPEILATLDNENKNRGLYFDAEHVPYCGKVMRVRSLVHQIVDERNGKMLHFKTPCVILEGAYCKAAYSEHRMFCPRAIFPYWRELWLERVDPVEVEIGSAGISAGV